MSGREAVDEGDAPVEVGSADGEETRVKPAVDDAETQVQTKADAETEVRPSADDAETQVQTKADAETVVLETTKPEPETDDKTEPADADKAKPEDEAKPDTKAEPEDKAEPEIKAGAEDKAKDKDADEGLELWAHFAPVPETPPTRARVIADQLFGRAGRFIGHEWTLAAVGSLMVAVAMTWPTLRHPATTIPQDTGDPLLVAWDLAWSGHSLTTDPAGLWNGNGFYPDKFTFAFSDTLLGYAPLGMIGSGPGAALVRYNILYVLIFALGLFGCYALIRQLGSGRTGAAVASAAIVFAPYRLSQSGHLHVLSIGGMMLALAMLARGHGFSLRNGYRPEKTRWGWVLAGWLTAAWQITIGFGIGLPFAYLLLAIAVVMAVGYLVKRRWLWKERRPFGLKLLLANVAGGLVFAAVTVLMAYPYLQVVKLNPNARRPESYLQVFSPPLNGFFIAPPESYLWGHAYAQARAGLSWAPEMTMLPGFFLYGLAAAGLFVSIWSLRQRILLGLGVVVTIVLAMGTNGPDGGRLGYLLLYRHLPGFDAIRTPGRLVVYATLLLGILAAGAVGAFARGAVELHNERRATKGHKAGVVLRLATLVPLVLVLLEGANKTPHPVVPTSPVAMHTIQDPAIILPSDEISDMAVLLWSTDGFPRVVNGGSGFHPQVQADLRNLMKNFPDQVSVNRLRELHIKSVVVLRSRVAGTEYERSVDAPIDGLNLTRTEAGDVVTYKVN